MLCVLFFSVLLGTSCAKGFKRTWRGKNITCMPVSFTLSYFIHTEYKGPEADSGACCSKFTISEATLNQCSMQSSIPGEEKAPGRPHCMCRWRCSFLRGHLSM